jgi:leukotriene-A4 hydrolase
MKFLLCFLFAVVPITVLANLQREGGMAIDPHTFARPNEARVKHLDLDVAVDFKGKEIAGVASLEIENLAGVNQLYLDTNRLTIRRITLDQEKEPTEFTLGKEVRPLGQALVVKIRPETKVVHIEYATSPDAGALQWLEPGQTRDKKKPFLYTQSQAILARSWIPCQDTPSVRMTYNARVKVPPDLLAIMSAENPTKKNQTGIYEFRMPQPIPSYLLALAVGDLEFRSTGELTGVYAEPSFVEQVAWEFAETPKMMETVEPLYGPYRWGRYDILVLPPSFPWGGMENPRLTFVTPTLVTGDRSLVATIAHELAHSWSGNLVTNATWNDFWLNEGFTNYLTHRIMEVVYGKDYAEMLSVLAIQDLQREVKELGPQSADTHLKYDLSGRDPEEGVTAIAYEKGEFFLRTIEAVIGREKFDAFLNQYFKTFAFQSMDSERFVQYLKENLFSKNPGLEEKINISAWIYGPGIPANIVPVQPSVFDKVAEQIRDWEKGKPADQLDTKGWTTHHWIHFIRNLPEQLSASQMEALDQAFHFSSTTNAEIMNEWLLQVIAKKYKPAYPSIEKFLASQGRRKYVKLLFTEMIKTPEGKEMAKEIYQRVRPGYHNVSREVAERILK